MTKRDEKSKRVFIAQLDDKNEIESVVLEALNWIADKKIKSETKVLIKPNFTYPNYKQGVSTSPDVIVALIKVLKEVTSNIAVIESNGGYHSWKAEEAFNGHKLFEIRKKYGIHVINLSKLERTQLSIFTKSGEVKIPFPKMLLDDDFFFVTVPVPKVHAMTGVSLALKNQWGCIPDTMRLRYHYIFDELIIEINRLLKPQLVVADGTYFLDENGPMDGKPVKMNVVIASNDIGSFELVLCHIMGIDINKISHLKFAQKKGIIPKSLGEIKFNDDIEKYKTHQFELKRTFQNYLALLAFKNKYLTRMVYDSIFADPIHKIFYAIKGKPLERIGY